MADASIDPVEDHIDDGADDGDDDAELEAMKARVKEMEAEAAKLRELQANADAAESGSASNGRAGSSTPAAGGEDEADTAMQEPQEDVDARSVYIGNVDYGSTPEEIQSHFAACGQINRVTILCDKFTGHPKGFAYVEFAEPAFVTNAMVLDESLFRGRLLKVTPKRTNIPGYNARGRGRGRGRGQRGGYGFQQPRGRGYRGRGRGYSG